MTHIPLPVRGEVPMTPDPENTSQWSETTPSAIESEASSASLTVTLQLLGRTCVLALAGDLVGSTVSALEAQVEQLAYLPARDVVLDLVNLVTLDEVGLNVLVGLSHYARGRGGHMTTMGASEDLVRRLVGTPLGADPT